MYRTIDASFWTDEKIHSLALKDRLVFAYLLTGPHSHVGGLYYLPIQYISLHTGLSDRVSKAALDTLSSTGLAHYDSDTCTVWVVNMFRYQGRGAKNEQAVANLIPSLHGSYLIDGFLRRYPSVIQWLKQEPRPKRAGIPKRLRFEVLERDGFRCAYCGASAVDKAIEVDHVIPVAKGGETSADNLKASCWDCNNGKADRVSEIPDTLSEFGTPNRNRNRNRTGTEQEQDCGSKAAATRARRLPDDWTPGRGELTWATNEGYSPSEVNQELPHFRDHWKAKGERRLDWPATWRNWMRNSRKFGGRNGTGESPEQLKQRQNVEAVRRVFGPGAAEDRRGLPGESE